MSARRTNPGFEIATELKRRSLLNSYFLEYSERYIDDLVCLGRFEHDIRLSDSVRSQNSETKSDKSIIQHMYSTKYDCQTLEEFLKIDNMKNWD